MIKFSESITKIPTYAITDKLVLEDESIKRKLLYILFWAEEFNLFEELCLVVLNFFHVSLEKTTLRFEFQVPCHQC